MNKFEADLDVAIDDALSRGVPYADIVRAASKRFPRLIMDIEQQRNEIWQKWWVTIICSLTPAFIYAIKADAIKRNYKLPDDEYFNWVCIVAFLAIVASHFKTVFEVLTFLRDWWRDLQCQK
ncbi:MAG: hypothetical protein K2X77_06865 [Candidatus Obscuribacterales bacterium]|nr:hypothetical protein [Candidatus Obscuribacterales bacterium]